MPKKRGGRNTAGSTGGNAAGKAVLGFILGLGVAAGAGYLYIHSTPRESAPTAPVAPAPAPANHAKASAPAPAPPRSAPFGTSEDVFEAGAHLYSVHCASCHGTTGRDAINKPPAEQFWRHARHSIAAQAPGDLYASIAAGSPAKGMPGYAHALTETQIWQLALLLKNADQDLPDPVVTLLNARPDGR